LIIVQIILQYDGQMDGWTQLYLLPSSAELMCSKNAAF